MVSAVSGPGVQITTAATGTKATNSVSMITSLRRRTAAAQNLKTPVIWVIRGDGRSCSGTRDAMSGWRAAFRLGD